MDLSRPPTTEEIEEQKALGDLMVDQLIQEMQDARGTNERAPIPLVDATDQSRISESYRMGRKGIRSFTGLSSRANVAAGPAAGELPSLEKKGMEGRQMVLAGIGGIGLALLLRKMDWLVALGAGWVLGALHIIQIFH